MSGRVGQGNTSRAPFDGTSPRRRSQPEDDVVLGVRLAVGPEAEQLVAVGPDVLARLLVRQRLDLHLLAARLKHVELDLRGVLVVGGAEVDERMTPRVEVLEEIGLRELAD